MNLMLADNLLDELLRTREGDRAAFGRVYDLAAPQLFAVALAVCRRRVVAEDVLQEAFVRIWRSARTFDPARGQPMAWMAAIVRRLAIDALRRQGREHALEPEDAAAIPDVDADPFVAVARGRDARAVRGCLDRLEGDQRRCILLAYFGGLSHMEVTAKSGLPLGTVKSHIRRGLGRLKQCLDL
jgi:RNA polymerase sigma-70 factor (ECF subfamily)